jgi:hypothetical protein
MKERPRSEEHILMGGDDSFKESFYQALKIQSEGASKRQSVRISAVKVEAPIQQVTSDRALSYSMLKVWRRQEEL